MKALVTGGGGFLGGYIVRALLERGDSVRVLGRRDYPELEELGVETFKGDIQSEKIVIDAARGVDTVFHVASKTGIWGKWDDFFQCNVTGTKNVIKACRENGISKLVYTSSPSVIHGGGDVENVDEAAPYPTKYISSYAESKAMAEKIVLGENGDDLFTVSLRPHLIWGPRDTNLIPRLIDRAKSGRLVKVGDCKNLVDTVYVENAAYAHILAAGLLVPESKICGEAYFITQGEPVVLWDWIETLLEGLGLPKLKKHISYNTAYVLGALFERLYSVLNISKEPPMTRFLASQLAKSHFFSPKKAEKDLGYTPSVSTEEGMMRLFSYYRKL